MIPPAPDAVPNARASTLYDAEELLDHIARRQAVAADEEDILLDEPSVADVPAIAVSAQVRDEDHTGYAIALILSLAISAGVLGSATILMLFRG